jgi:hypothetical protein
MASATPSGAAQDAEAGSAEPTTITKAHSTTVMAEEAAATRRRDMLPLTLA